MIVRIKNLRLRTIIGIHDWEQKNKQDIIINIKFEFDGDAACKSDDIADTVDYMSMKKEIIQEVEQSSFGLLEKLTSHILQVIMKNKRVIKATVEIDKPHALRFADSVSISCTAKRNNNEQSHY